MTALETPESLREEHHELFHELEYLARGKGETGRRVRKLLTVLEPHFEKEEATAMPLLGALRVISEGKGIRYPSEVISLQERFSAEYPAMLKEHVQVKRLIDSVRDAAKRTREQRALAMMDELEHHAVVEEEVLYPAAMLVAAVAGGSTKLRSP
jgi:hypothetical protein